MFFANALKDYASQLHDLTLLIQADFSLFILLKILFFYLVDSIKFVFIYIFSCQWLTNFTELPCFFQSSYIAVLKGENPLDSYVNPTFFEFLDPEFKSAPSFLTGVFNSFFLALPISVPHLLTLRAFLINGLPAGIVTAAGTIFGQITFYSCVLFGFEFFLIPFVKFEPFNYILGFVLVVNIIYTLAHNSTKEVLRFYPNPEVKIFLRFFFLNFILAWTEQASLFQYFGNLTFHNLPTLLQGTGISSYFSPTFFYLMGVLVGSIGWTLFFGFLVTIFLNHFSNFFKIPFLFLKEKIHQFLLVLTFTLSLTSIPYYGFDYLISAPMGFVSQDKALHFLKAKTYYSTKAIDAGGGFFAAQTLNPIPFDRPSQMEDFSISKAPTTFEECSLDSENCWKNRITLTQGKRGLQTSRRSSRNSDFEAEKEKREAEFQATFYQSSRDAVLQMAPLELLQTLEKNVDKLASELFNPLAYNYYTIASTIREFDQSDPTVRQEFRERFYKNPVYKALVHLDMTGFLQGQPSFLNLSSKEEHDLFARQILLQNYVRSVFDFKKGPPNFKQTASSYAEKVYNQQFKGSLDLVRHYFSIYLTNEADLEQITASKKVLKFDQPLYNNSIRDYPPFLHEELEYKSQNETFLDSELQEESYFENQKESKVNLTPLIDSTPFYIGWDSTVRKFLVKNSCIPGVPLKAEIFAAPLKNKTKDLASFPLYLGFQSWPIDAINLKKLTDKNVSIAYIPLSKDGALKVTKFFKLQSTPLLPKAGSKSQAAIYTNFLLNQKNLPSYDWGWFLAESGNNSVAELDVSKKLKPYIDLGNTLPPQLGGFSWPGEGFTK